MTRTEAREIMMQILFELDASKTIHEEIASSQANKIIESKLTGNHIQRGKTIIGNILEHLDEIDGIINESSTKWKTSRMPKVDLAIMRLAVGEFRYNDNAAEPVVINEAVNLAKKYSTDQSAKFINGVLGAIVNS